MTARLVWLAASLPCMLGAVRQEPVAQPIRLRTEAGWILVRNYDRASGTATGGLKILGAGSPMEVEDTGRGLLVRGKAMRVEFSQTEDNKYVLDAFTVSDGGHIVLDDKIAFDTAVQVATQARPAPKAPPSFARTVIDSESVSYARTGLEGVITIPNAAKVVSDSKGSVLGSGVPAKVTGTFTQTLQIEGTKARFTVGLMPDGKVASPRSMLVNGPVTFHLVRNETSVDPKDAARTVTELTDIQGQSDQLEGQFEGPSEPAITATGKVHIQGAARGMPGEVSGEKAVVTLSKEFKPIRYEFIGSPAKTRVVPGSGGK